MKKSSYRFDIAKKTKKSKKNKPENSSMPFSNQWMLQLTRDNITSIDEKIVEWIAMRMQHSAQIGKLKKKMKLPVYDPSQETKVYKRATKNAKHYKVDTSMIVRIYQLILEESKKVQQ